MVKAFFLENWKPKLASLLIALAIWYLITSHLESERPSFPIPGTSNPPTRTSTVPELGDDLLAPLVPPVPGGENGN